MIRSSAARPSAALLLFFFAPFSIDGCSLFLATDDLSSSGSADAAAEPSLTDGSPATDPTGDATTTAEVGPDADAPPPCDPTKSFKPAVLLSVPVTTPLNSPQLSADERTLFFQTRTSSSTPPDVWMATRSSPSGPFANARAVGVNGPFADGNPSVSADGLQLFFTSNRVGPTDFDILVATRPTVDAPFAPPTIVQQASSVRADYEPYVTYDGNEIWFVRSMATTAGDIYRVAAKDVAATAEPLTELNSAMQESHPVLAADGLVVFFARANASTLTDILTARRQSRTEPFGDVTPVSELNTNAEEIPGWISPDGCRLYFERYENGRSDFWVAERPK